MIFQNSFNKKGEKHSGFRNYVNKKIKQTKELPAKFSNLKFKTGEKGNPILYEYV